MKFKEALEKKKRIGDKYYMKNIDLYGDVVVAPKNKSDLHTYLGKYNVNKIRGLNDDIAKFYSSNNQYSVYAICISNGINHIEI